MKILFISSSVPPFPESQSIRNYFFVLELLKRGHEIVLIHPYFEKKDKTLCIEHQHLSRMETELPKLAKASKTITNSNAFAGRVINLLINAFIPPDPLFGWDSVVIEKLKDYPMDSVDVIVSSSGSYTAHIAASLLKSNFPKLKWLADYGDPWLLCPTWPGNSWIHKKVNARNERKAMAFADRVIWTTDETTKVYGSAYPDYKDKFVTIPCGYNPIDTSPIEIADKSREQQFIFSYVGTAYKMTRNIQPVIESIISLNSSIDISREKDYIFKAVGPVSNKFIENILSHERKYVRFTGHVDYLASCLEISNKADVLIFIGNRGGVQIPAKLYQYLSTDIPILFISQSRNDPSARLCSDLAGIVYVNQNSRSNMQEQCSELIRNYEHYKSQSLKRKSFIQNSKLSWGELATDFCDIMVSL
jgi:glycosyltransferase involved in cell wall biosynthesis